METINSSFVNADDLYSNNITVLAKWESSKTGNKKELKLRIVTTPDKVQCHYELTVSRRLEDQTITESYTSGKDLEKMVYKYNSVSV